MPESAPYLRPIPGNTGDPVVAPIVPDGEAFAGMPVDGVPDPAVRPPADAADPAAPETPGLTHPARYGRDARFVTVVLVALGYVGAERVEAAVGESRLAGKAPERLLLEQNAIDARQLSRAIAERYGLDHVDLTAYPVDMAAANLLPISSARRYQAVPVGYADAGTLLVAMADPANVLAADDIKMATGLQCRMIVADPADIETLLSRVNSLQSAVAEAVLDDEREAGEDGLDPLGAVHAPANTPAGV